MTDKESLQRERLIIWTVDMLNIDAVKQVYVTTAKPIGRPERGCLPQGAVLLGYASHHPHKPGPCLRRVFLAQDKTCKCEWNIATQSACERSKLVPPCGCIDCRTIGAKIDGRVTPFSCGAVRRGVNNV